MATDLFDSNFDLNENATLLEEQNVLAGSLEPNAAGLNQVVLFSLSRAERDTAYFIAVRAVDKAQKSGRVSNMAAFYLSSSPVKVEGYDDTERTGLDNAYLGSLFVISGAVGFVLVMLVFAVAIRMLGNQHKQYSSVSV